MAVLSSRAQERRSSEIRTRSARERAANFKLLPPQSPRGFSALARLYYLARPTKTAMLRRLYNVARVVIVICAVMTEKKSTIQIKVNV